MGVCLDSLHIAGTTSIDCACLSALRMGEPRYRISMAFRLKSLGVTGAVAAVVVAAALFAGLTSTTSSARVQAKSAATSEDESANSQQLEFLAREILALKAHVEAEKRKEPSSVPSSVTSAASPTPEHAPPDNDQPASDAELHAHRVVSYASILGTEPRDSRVAADFEASVVEAFSKVKHSRLTQVDCRSTICKLEIRHEAPDGRQRFGEFLFGPLKYGTYDYLSDDGQATIAFVGMPGHPLPSVGPTD